MDNKLREKLQALGYEGTDQQMMQAHMRAVFKGAGPSPIPATFNTLPKPKLSLVDRIKAWFKRS